ncbi:MAG: GGDEF domain-containing protein, partial [Arcobacter sp.]|nr:GGDEF domain-containing protein [Arcobacter sp.]
MKNKIAIRMILLMLIFGFTLIGFQTYNTRADGISSGLKKADAIAEVVKSGLTAHMINGNMSQQSVFLTSIEKTKNIDTIRIIRGENVIKQYGKSLDLVAPQDDIDDNVIKTGKAEHKLIETMSTAKLRVTIPYKATNGNDINCLSCHDVKFNDTLGAVTIVLDVTDFKD